MKVQVTNMKGDEVLLDNKEIYFTDAKYLVSLGNDTTTLDVTGATFR